MQDRPRPFSLDTIPRENPYWLWNSLRVPALENLPPHGELPPDEQAPRGTDASSYTTIFTPTALASRVSLFSDLAHRSSFSDSREAIRMSSSGQRTQIDPVSTSTHQAPVVFDRRLFTNQFGDSFRGWLQAGYGRSLLQNPPPADSVPQAYREIAQLLRDLESIDRADGHYDGVITNQGIVRFMTDQRRLASAAAQHVFPEPRGQFDGVQRENRAFQWSSVSGIRQNLEYLNLLGAVLTTEERRFNASEANTVYDRLHRLTVGYQAIGRSLEAVYGVSLAGFERIPSRNEDVPPLIQRMLSGTLNPYEARLVRQVLSWHVDEEGRIHPQGTDPLRAQEAASLIEHLERAAQNGESLYGMRLIRPWVDDLSPRYRRLAESEKHVLFALIEKEVDQARSSGRQDLEVVRREAMDRLLPQLREHLYPQEVRLENYVFTDALSDRIRNAQLSPYETSLLRAWLHEKLLEEGIDANTGMLENAVHGTAQIGRHFVSPENLIRMVGLGGIFSIVFNEIFNSGSFFEGRVRTLCGSESQPNVEQVRAGFSRYLENQRRESRLQSMPWVVGAFRLLGGFAHEVLVLAGFNLKDVLGDESVGGGLNYMTDIGMIGLLTYLSHQNRNQLRDYLATSEGHDLCQGRVPESVQLPETAAADAARMERLLQRTIAEMRARGEPTLPDRRNEPRAPRMTGFSQAGHTMPQEHLSVFGVPVPFRFSWPTASSLWRSFSSGARGALLVAE